MFGAAIAAVSLLAMTHAAPDETRIVRPSDRQLAWHQMGYYAFVHFGPNTFTNREWGEGKEDPKVFNPSRLDCRQWARTFRAAGMKGVILTAKHHDGFCLWPSRFSTHTIAQSAVPNRDIMCELSDACRAEGLKLGVYLSPWDRNHPAYGTPAYNQVFANMLTEVLGNYGPIFEVWFDGANGEGPDGKRQVYDWDLYIRTVRKLQPKAVIFSDGGPDIRWVGNESGIASETSWNTLNRARYVPGTPHSDELGEGQANGTDWVPPECDVSIRPGWFYHPEQDAQVKSGAQLMDLYLKSVGRGSSLLLNVPPDRRGLISDADIKALGDFRTLREATLGHPVRLPARIDHVELREDIRQGQRVARFRVEAQTADGWKTVARGTTIGHRRILPIDPLTARAVRVVAEESRATPHLLTPISYAGPQVNRESIAERDARMRWWREARFGMFIHWGLYSIPAGNWKGKEVPGAAEWLMNSAQIPRADYMPLIHQFNPVKYDPKAWVALAKRAGMRYIVITTKHHEGFGLWPSAVGDFNVANTPCRKDLLKPLAEECKKQGIRLCFYHSIMDWTYPDYLPRRSWDNADAARANFDRYVTYMKAQLKELLTQYGDIGILWFDGEWEGTWTHEQGESLYKFVRTMSPKTIVNNRVGKGRNGMQGMTADGATGDYGTPEQEIPAQGLPGVDWESCMTMNDTWGFSSHDHNWKSTVTLIQNLVDCASKGGNYLLNVGPTALGEIPPESVERLNGIGDWMQVHHDAIYATGPSPFPQQLPWGRITTRLAPQGGTLYLHVFNPQARVLDLRGLHARIQSARVMGDPSARVTVRAVDGGYEIALPEGLRGPIPVIEVAVTGPVSAENPPIPQAADGSVELRASVAQTQGAARYEPAKDAIGFWTDARSSVHWRLLVKERVPTVLDLEFACDDAAAGSEIEVQIGPSTFRYVVVGTGGWDKFRRVQLGDAPLITPGIVPVNVTVKTMPNGAVMNLKAIRLIPQ